MKSFVSAVGLHAVVRRLVMPGAPLALWQLLELGTVLCQSRAVLAHVAEHCHASHRD